VDGLSIQVMASDLSALKCLVAEGVIKSGTVDGSADILARCANTTPADGLRASTSDSDPGMATGLSCDFGGTALQAVVTVKGLSSPVTASSLSAPSCSVAIGCAKVIAALKDVTIKKAHLPCVHGMSGLRVRAPTKVCSVLQCVAVCCSVLWCV